MSTTGRRQYRPSSRAGRESPCPGWTCRGERPRFWCRGRCGRLDRLSHSESCWRL